MRPAKHPETEIRSSSMGRLDSFSNDDTERTIRAPEPSAYQLRTIPMAVLARRCLSFPPVALVLVCFLLAVDVLASSAMRTQDTFGQSPSECLVSAHG